MGRFVSWLPLPVFAQATGLPRFTTHPTARVSARHSHRFDPPRSRPHGARMLRINSIATQPDAITLKLEGKLLEAWCGELRSACQLAREQVSLVTLDLMDVSFIDVAGLD